MAQRTIKKLGLSAFVATPNADMSGGTFSGSFDGQTVVFSFTYTETGSFDTLKTLYTIPAAYRPSANADIPAIVYTASGTPVTNVVRVAPNGTIVQRASGSAQKVFATGSYTI